MSSLWKQEPTGSFKYERSYETAEDTRRNKTLAPMQQRFRSYSVGEMDASGNRTKRQHFHEDASYKRFSSGTRPNAGPHTSGDVGTVTKTAIMRTVAATAEDYPPLGSSPSRKK